MSPAASRRRPNILLILADDMGFSDLGCYGSEIATPHLDGLAAGGARLSQFYNCARCCPTRASLLTGLHPSQTGVGQGVGNLRVPGYEGYLHDRCVTIAEVLGAAGYSTSMSGKWHVGGPYYYNQPAMWCPGAPGRPIPTQRGFDRYYGILGGASNYFSPRTLAEDDHIVEPEGTHYHLTDEISGQAISMIEGSAKTESPFFLYLSYTAPHWPLHAWPEDIARQKGRYRKGWDALRAERHERLRALKILDEEWPISARNPDAPAWEGIPHRDWEEMRMEVYAAQVAAMDHGIGRVLARLRELGMEEDTLVIFLSDNGGCAEFLAEDGPGRPERYDVRLPSGRAMRVGNSPRIRPGPADTFQSYGLPWANMSNAPFRMFKKWVHEGGISTPFIVRWPGVVRAGAIHHATAHAVDVMATCLEAAGVAYPREFRGNPIPPTEGESLLPLLRGHSWERQHPLFWEHVGNRAARLGRWKLVSEHGKPWELYDMASDRTEGVNLAGLDPKRVRELEAAHDEWARRCGVLTPEELERRHATVPAGA